MNQLMRLRNSYLTSIYSGMIEKKTVKEIHKELYDNTMKYKKIGLPIDNRMYDNAKKLTSKIKKQIPSGLGIIELPLVTFALLEKEKSYEYLTQNIYKIATKREDDRKVDILKNTIKNNRELLIPNIFYLASEHNDSASDHKDYQGKIYIDEKWRSLIQDKELRKQINIYINKNDIKTIQWVTFRPVWFVTRPNCRHYFRTIPTEKVLNISRNDLIEEYNMHTAIGNREYLQTISHSTNKKWYEDTRNAELILKRYKERYKYHNELFNQYPCETLSNALKKDLYLIKKWKDYIEKKMTIANK